MHRTSGNAEAPVARLGAQIVGGDAGEHALVAGGHTRHVQGVQRGAAQLFVGGDQGGVHRLPVLGGGSFRG